MAALPSIYVFPYWRKESAWFAGCRVDDGDNDVR
jgi:hypothetical protein